MRRSRPTNRLRAWLCLVAYVLTGTLAGTHQVVLCVGPSGHLAIELVDASPCDGCVGVVDHGAAFGEGAIVAAPDASQCPCVDVPMVLGSTDVQAKPSRRISAPDGPAAPALACEQSAPIAAPEPRLPSSALRATAPREGPRLLRTVVFLV